MVALMWPLIRQAVTLTRSFKFGGRGLRLFEWIIVASLLALVLGFLAASVYALFAP